MTKRKYSNYIVVSDDIDETFENYKEAFSEYNRQSSATTMYGIDGQGSIYPIFSKL